MNKYLSHLIFASLTSIAFNVNASALPDAALAACNNKNESEACSFKHNGETIVGACKKQNLQLICFKGTTGQIPQPDRTGGTPISN